MKTENCASLALATVLLWSIGTNAAADAHQSPPSPGVLDTYACDFNDGKDMDDLMSARDYYVEQYDKAGITVPTAHLWSLVKGNAPVQMIWFDLHESLAAFASSLDAIAAASGLDKVQERFDSVVTCQSSNVGTYVPVYEREGDGDGDGAVFISSNACTAKQGINDEHITDLQRHIAGVLNGMKGTTPLAVYMATPITGGPDSADRYLFVVNDSASAWAEFVMGVGSSEAWPQLDRHFEMVFDCNTTMWSSQQVVGAEG